MEEDFGTLVLEGNLSPELEMSGEMAFSIVDNRSIASYDQAGSVMPSRDTFSLNEYNGLIDLKPEIKERIGNLSKLDGIYSVLIQANDICDRWVQGKEYKRGDLCYVTYTSTEPTTGEKRSHVDIYIAIKDNITVNPMLTSATNYWQPYFKTVGQDNTKSVTVKGGVTTDGAEGNIQAISFVGESRKSKNLLRCTMQTSNKNGLTCTRYNNADGSLSHYVLNGTSDNLVIFELGYYSLPQGSYKLLGCPQGGSTTSYYLDCRKDTSTQVADTGNGSVFNTNEESNVLARIIIPKSGIVCNNLVFKPMITADTSATYNDYEPYGILTPQGKVESGSKNYAEPKLASASASGITIIRLDDGTYQINGTATEDVTFRIDQSTRLGTDNLKTYRGQYFIQLFVSPQFIFYPDLDVNVSVVQNKNGAKLINSGQNNIGTLDANDCYIELFIRAGQVTNGIYAIKLDKNVGDRPQFEPYKQSSINASEIAPDKPLYGIGDIKNTLEVFADGSGIYTRRIGKDVFNQAMSFSMSTYRAFFQFLTYNASIEGRRLSNYDNNTSIWDSTNTRKIYIQLDSSYTLEKANAMFSAKPFEILYELETPIVEPLTSKEVAEFLSLKTFNNGTIYTDAETEIVYYSNTPIGQTVANVSTRINANAIDVADTKSMISDEWLSTKTYAQGEYCISNNSLWKSKVNNNLGNVPTEGSYWTACSVSKELSVFSDDYRIDGLTFNRCTYLNGGYKKVGKMCFVVLRVKADDSEPRIRIEGIGSKVTFAFAVNDEQASTIKEGYITNNEIGINSAIVNNTYDICITYLCNN